MSATFKMPAWFNEGLQRRFDQLTQEVDEDPKIKAYFDQMRQALKQMETEMDGACRLPFLQWEEQWFFAQSLEKEWYYMKGVKDGAQLMLSLVHEPGGL